MDFQLSEKDLHHLGTDPVLANANMEIWPMTRIGAIVVVIIMCIVTILLWFIPRRVYDLYQVDEDPNSTQTIALQSQYRLFGFWVAGFDTVKVEGDQIFIHKNRLIQCCGTTKADFHRSQIKNVNLVVRKAFPFGILMGLWVSCLIGLWLHFIPCFWWTCDWGHFDGQQIRGAIWFITWFIAWIGFTIAYRTVHVSITLKPKQEGGRSKVYTLAIGGSASWDVLDDPVDEDFLKLKTLLYGVKESKKEKFTYRV